MIEERTAGASGAPAVFLDADRADAMQWARFAAVVLVAGFLWGRGYYVVVAIISLFNPLHGTEHVALNYALLYAVRDIGYGAILFAAYRGLMRGRPISDLGIRPFTAWHAALGVAVGVAFWNVEPRVMQALHLHGTDVMRFDVLMHRYMHGVTAALMFTSTALVSPIVQEIYFRGTLLTALRKSTPLWVAIAGSSLVFAVWHHTGGMRQMSQTFVFGVITAVLYLRTRNLAAPCFMHIAVNAHAELSMLGVLH